LAVCYGWVFDRQAGSHRIYDNPNIDQPDYRILNFQPRKGKAKPRQLRQLLDAIQFLGDDE